MTHNEHSLLALIHARELAKETWRVLQRLFLGLLVDLLALRNVRGKISRDGSVQVDARHVDRHGDGEFRERDRLFLRGICAEIFSSR